MWSCLAARSFAFGKWTRLVCSSVSGDYAAIPDPSVSCKASTSWFREKPRAQHCFRSLNSPHWSIGCGSGGGPRRVGFAELRGKFFGLRSFLMFFVSNQKRPILSVDLAASNKSSTSCVVAQVATFEINQIVSWHKPSNVFQGASFVVVGEHSLHVDVAHDHHGRCCATKVLLNGSQHPMVAYLPWNFLLHMTDKAVFHVLVKRICSRPVLQQHKQRSSLPHAFSKIGHAASV
jgi:hypothetical protein